MTARPVVRLRAPLPSSTGGIFPDSSKGSRCFPTSPTEGSPTSTVLSPCRAWERLLRGCIRGCKGQS